MSDMNLRRNSGFLFPVEKEFERIVFAELLVPETLNTYGDYHSRESIREFAYEFMKQGFGKDVEHSGIDNPDIKIIESFIARDGDPDFVPGSWVIGMYVGDESIWNQILAGEINGFSYEALVTQFAAEVILPINNVRFGTTQPDPIDDHTHSFMVVLDENDRVAFGGTTENNAHFHTISDGAKTDKSLGHSHTYNFIRSENRGLGYGNT